MSSPPAKKAKTELSTKNKNINKNNIIPAPTSKGWGKSEWEKWSNEEDAKYDKLEANNQNNWEELHEYINKRRNAVQSAAPDEITVKIYIKEVIDNRNNAAATTAGTSTTSCNKNVSEIVISKQGNDTFRSILDRYCQEHNIERDDYHWNHKHKVVIGYPGDENLLNRTDVKCFDQFWHVHPPTLIKRFIDENTFMPEVVGRLKRSPAPKPSVAPPFDKLKSLPPSDGNASKEDWDKWRRENCGGCIEFWMQRKKAIEYAAPDEIDVQLKGLSHEHTVKVNTDDPLCIALASYCASTSGTLAVTSSEVILREYGSDEPKFIDAQTTSARMRFSGYTPLKLEVVYRDTSRTEREIESIQGIIPEGYQQFLGAGYVRGFVFDVSILLSF
jgi:hypothetical protein